MRGGTDSPAAVDGDFTLAAGRGIWGGFPKILADFDTDHRSATRRASVSEGGQLIAELIVAPGISVPGSGATASVAAYSSLDAVTRRTSWDMNPTGMRSRIGGAQLRLGDAPDRRRTAVAGSTQTRLVSSSIGNLAMTFGNAVGVPAR